MMTEPYQLSASLEDYIEAIYHIVAESHEARSKEIAARLDVTGASVTEALRLLSKKGLINYTPYEAITLTDKGLEIARDVVRRHNALKQFFIEVLGIDQATAEQGACRVEHSAPQEIIDQMINFINFIEACPGENRQLIQDFITYCRKQQKK
jgi:DtxR family transcriptional regulator, Mn-dependent transcriptional regulator